MLSRALLVSFVVACSSSYTNEPAPPGTSCATDADCGRGSVCVDDGDRRQCTRECRDVGPTPDCPEGWTCGEGDDTRPTVCRCEAAIAERCNERDDDCDGAVDEGLGCRPIDPPDPDGCGEALDCFDVRSTPLDTVDLLLVIDNSGSMAQEQKTLTRQLPRLFSALTSGDLDADGVAELAPVRSLHVGVVSTDMGVGGFTVPTCAGRFGDDGVLLTRGRVMRPVCAEAFPSFFEFAADDDTTELAVDVACVAGMGTAGCGFEQQLEAMLKPVTPSTSALRFDGDTTGHADGLNAGFLRPDSILLIVLLTDEEDCSAADPTIFDPANTTFDGNLSLRCFEYGDPARGFVHPIERFVDGLLATRIDSTRLVVSAIVGIPEATSPAPGTRPDWTSILGHPDMQEIYDPVGPSRLRPSCDRTDEAGDRSLAFPPRRIVRTLEALDRAGAHATVQTICRDDFSPVVDATVLALGDAMTPCFARTIDAPRCALVETLPHGRVCAELPGRTLREQITDTSGRTLDVCTVAPRGASSDGWSYAPNDSSCSSTRPNRIQMTSPPVDGASLRLECER